MSLMENAAALAGRAPEESLFEEPIQSGPDMSNYEISDGDPEMVPVHIAWLRVRRDIRAIGKGELYNQSGTRFNFRGVDTVVNVFGPVTLKHGVHVLPVKVEAEYGEKTTKSGSKMRECTVLTTWEILGPKGDKLVVQTRGEALDTADKSTTKAQSVALRTLLLTLGLTPTSDPDPDSQRLERGEAPVRPVTNYLDEISDPRTSAGRLRQIHFELKQTNQLGVSVRNEVGDDEAIGDMVVRIGKERAAAGGAS